MGYFEQKLHTYILGTPETYITYCKNGHIMSPLNFGVNCAFKVSVSSCFVFSLGFLEDGKQIYNTIQLGIVLYGNVHVYIFVNFFILFELFPQPKPATTPTLTRPQGQPSPSIVMQQPPAVYGQTMFQMYPLTPVSPGVQVSVISFVLCMEAHIYPKTFVLIFIHVPRSLMS